MSDRVAVLVVEREPLFRRGPAGSPAAEVGMDSRGQSLVELALALPVLLLILLGTLDLGRVFFDYIQLRGAVHEGAAYGARHPTDDAGIVARVRDHGIPPGTVVLPPACAPGLAACTTPGATAKIVVAAQRTFTPVTTAFLQDYFGIEPWTITVSATMRVMT